MWYHLRERFKRISVRVLHPLIQATSFVDVKRGLPEGSRLSPTLFGIVAADLIRELQKEFPHISIQCASHAQGGHPLAGGLSSTNTVWVGGFFYVDDLCLCSTDPLELQAMINFVQKWSERSRLQINAQKTKIMPFHETKKQGQSPVTHSSFQLDLFVPVSLEHTFNSGGPFRVPWLLLGLKTTHAPCSDGNRQKSKKGTQLRSGSLGVH